MRWFLFDASVTASRRSDLPQDPVRNMVLRSSVIALVALLAACSSETEDPAAQPDGGVPGNDTGTGDAVGGPDGGTVVPDASGGEDTDAETDAPAPDVTPGEDTDVQVDAGPGNTGGGGGDDVTDSGTPRVCELAEDFTGQVDVEASSEPDGGAPRFTPYDATYDAGIDDAIAAVPAEDTTVDATVTVTGATVIATDFFSDSVAVPRNRTRFWIADGQGAIGVELDFMNSAQEFPETIRVGSQISFETTKIRRSFGVGTIREARNWELVEVGQPVYIRDVTAALTTDDVGSLVRVHGTLTGEPECCDSEAACANTERTPNRCWDLSYLDGSSTVRFRSNSSFLETGDCVTYVGPLTSFDNSPQLSVLNFDWVFEPR